MKKLWSSWRKSWRATRPIDYVQIFALVIAVQVAFPNYHTVQNQNPSYAITVPSSAVDNTYEIALNDGAKISLVVGANASGDDSSKPNGKQLTVTQIQTEPTPKQVGMFWLRFIAFMLLLFVFLRITFVRTFELGHEHCSFCKGRSRPHVPWYLWFRSAVILHRDCLVAQAEKLSAEGASQGEAGSAPAKPKK